MIIGKSKHVMLAAVACLSMLPTMGWSTPGPAAAPNFSIANIHGGRINLDDFKGSLVYVDFWASWCGPCRKSFPFMEELQQQYGDDLAVIAINMDKEEGDAHRFLADHEVTFLIGHDPNGDVAKQFGVIAMPSSFIIDRDGLIQEAHTGFKSKDVKKIHSKLGELL